jgi:hypothetical protein
MVLGKVRTIHLHSELRRLAAHTTFQPSADIFVLAKSQMLRSVVPGVETPDPREPSNVGNGKFFVDEVGLAFEAVVEDVQNPLGLGGVSRGDEWVQ